MPPLEAAAPSDTPAGSRTHVSGVPAKNDDLLSRPLSSKGGEGNSAAALRLDALLFGESQGRVIISVAAVNAVKVLAQAKILGVSAARIGTVGGASLEIKAGGAALGCELRELHDLWWNAIARAMR